MRRQVPAAPPPLPVPAPEPPAALTAADLRAAAAGVLAQRVSPKYLEEHCLLPLALTESGELLVAAGAPLDPTVIDELCWTYERPVRLIDAPAAEIHAAILSAQAGAATSWCSPRRKRRSTTCGPSRIRRP